VGKDEATAVRWYKQAANQGLARAELALALAYWVGKGTAQDRGEAIEWTAKAAAHDDPQIQKIVAALRDIQAPPSQAATQRQEQAPPSQAATQRQEQAAANSPNTCAVS